MLVGQRQAHRLRVDGAGDSLDVTHSSGPVN